MSPTDKIRQTLELPPVQKRGTRRWMGGRDFRPNEQCPKCDSGKKYKKCCGRFDWGDREEAHK